MTEEDDTLFAVSEKGWTDQELGLEYLVNSLISFQRISKKDILSINNLEINNLQSRR